MTQAFSAQSFLRSHGRQVVAAVAGAPVAGGRIEAALLSASGSCAVLRIGAGGREKVVKAFAPGDAAARARFARETACLVALTGSGLAPDLVASNPQGHFVVMDHVPGMPLDRALDAASLAQRARQIGRWYRRLNEAMPKEPAEGSWWDYLARYHEPELAHHLAPLRADLERMRLRRQTLAKNDGHLSNFILTPADELVGLDFEAARVKPEGWDILLAARSLARMFPQHLDSFVPALVGGWRNDDGAARVVPAPALVRAFAEAFSPVGALAA